jgi:methanogenic corrinoid protein MtbC1
MDGQASRGGASAAGRLSIGALARASGVPVETLRTWEHRYGFPAAERTPAGQRLYPAATAGRVRRMAAAIAAGHRAGAVVPATDAELDRLELVTAVDAGPLPPAPRPAAASIDDLLDSVAAFDTDRLTASLWADWGRLGPLEFLRATVAPLVERVGREWSEGRMEVRHEHFLSECLGDVMGAIRLHLDQRASGPSVVCATLPGEMHTLGLQMAALMMAVEGLHVVYLGAEVPPAELARVARELGAAAVAISVSVASDQDEVERHLARLREALPSSVMMLIGGAGAPAGRAGTVTVGGFEGLARWAREQRARPGSRRPGKSAR